MLATIKRITSFVQLKAKVDQAPDLKFFRFREITPPDEIKVVEPHCTTCFILPFLPDSKQYFSFLKSLRALGFDIFGILSMPKGEVATLFHGSLKFLQAQLQSSKIILFPSLRNKLRLRGYFQDGRLHIRLYRHKEQILVTSHIDPPDFFGHINLPKHLIGKVRTDYVYGEKILSKVLTKIGTISEP